MAEHNIVIFVNAAIASNGDCRKLNLYMRPFGGTMDVGKLIISVDGMSYNCEWISYANCVVGAF